jgi:hypothetical protein
MEVWLHVAGYADSDAQERGELAFRLQEELGELDLEDVSRPSGRLPEGAKGTAVEWAELVVSLAGTLPPLMAALRAWLGRHPGAEITLEVDGDRLTLSDATAGERCELLESWMARHAG